MTIKQERAAALDHLKDNGIGRVLYRVEVLNASFLPSETFTFDTIKEAENKYAALLGEHFPAFIQKYAVVAF